MESCYQKIHSLLWKKSCQCFPLRRQGNLTAGVVCHNYTVKCIRTELKIAYIYTIIGSTYPVPHLITKLGARQRFAEKDSMFFYILVIYLDIKKHTNYFVRVYTAVCCLHYLNFQKQITNIGKMTELAVE